MFKMKRLEDVEKKLTFCGVKAGECFVSQTGVFVKLPDGNAFCFSSCEVQSLSPDSEVKRVEATLEWRLAE